MTQSDMIRDELLEAQTALIKQLEKQVADLKMLQGAERALYRGVLEGMRELATKALQTTVVTS